MRRLLLLPLFLLLVSSALAQDDGRLYNPPGLEMRGWLDRTLRARRQRVNDTGGVTDMTPSEAASIVVVERQAQELVQAILPMIFFNAGESRFPARYRLIGSPAISGGYTDTAAVSIKMSESAFGSDPSSLQRIAKYYELIDIVGCRLRRYPDAHLRLEGGYSGEPGESADVAALRAQAVRDHLVTMWGIAPDRIEMMPPRQACAPSAPILRQDEARRVLFLCNEPRVLEPVRFDVLGTEEMMLNLQFTLIPRFQAQDIRDMELSVAIGDALVYRSSLQVSPDSTVYHYHGITPIMWAVDDPAALRNQVVAQVVITLNDGRQFLSNQSKLAFTERIISRRSRSYQSDAIEFELPYFEWRDTAITALQAPMFSQMVRGIDSILSDPQRIETARARSREVSERMVQAERALDSAMASVSAASENGPREAETTAVESEEPVTAVVESEESETPPNSSVESEPVAVDTAESPVVDTTEAIAAESVSVETAYDSAMAYEYEEPPTRMVLVSETPRLLITAGADITEGYDADLTPYLSARSVEPWREMGSIVLKPLMDRMNPPKLLLITGTELDDKEAQQAWLGFDVEEQMESMMAEQRAMMEKREPVDSTLFDSDSPIYQGMQERTHNLVRGRGVAMRDLLIRAGFGDSSRVRFRVDTTSEPRYVNAMGSPEFLAYGGAASMALPEQRYAARMVTVTLRLDPEYEYSAEQAQPLNWRRGVRAADRAVEVEESSSESVSPP